MLTWAGWLPEIPEPLPIRIAIAIGVTAVGGFVAGLIVQILTRTTMQLRAPGPAVNLVRIAGATASGLAAVLLLFGSGTGPGGKGSPGDKGDGEKDSSSHVENRNDRKDERDDRKKPIMDTPAGEVVLKIEVLNYDRVRKIVTSGTIEDDRRYRVTTADGPKVMTLGEVVNYLVELSEMKRTPDRLNLVSYRNETLPEDRSAALEKLQKLARDLHKDKVKDGWIKAPILDEEPPS